MRRSRKKWIVILAALLLLGVVSWWVWPRPGVVITFLRFEPSERQGVPGHFAVFSVENRLPGLIHFQGDLLEFRLRRADGWERQPPLSGHGDARWGTAQGERSLLYAHMNPAAKAHIMGPFQIGLQVFEPPSVLGKFLPGWLLDFLPASAITRKRNIYYSEPVTP